MGGLQSRPASNPVGGIVSFVQAVPVALQQRRAMLRNGYHPVPVRTGTKAPTVPDWRGVAADATAESVATWPADHGSTGVLCGAVRGVDIDVLDARVADAVELLAYDAFGMSPLRRVGQAPKVLLLYRAADPAAGKVVSARFTLPGLFKPSTAKLAELQVEVLGAGQQALCYGTHPDTGRPYTWAGVSPEDVPLADLPVVTEAQVVAFLAAAEAAMLAAGCTRVGDRARVTKAAGSSRVRPPSEAAVVELLNRLPNPASAGRNDTYLPVMYAAKGCIDDLGADPHGPIAEAAIDWAERWEGGSETDERAKWRTDFARAANAKGGWDTLRGTAHRLLPGYVDGTAGGDFEALPVLPLADLVAPDCELTEDSVALAFADATVGRLVYDHTAGRWYRWDGARWCADLTDWTFGQARRFARGVRAKAGAAAAGSAGKIAFAAAVERASRSDTRLAVTQDVWDRDPWVLGVPSGVVDLRTGVLAPADPARYISRQAAVAPAPAGTPAPLWTAFLESATQGDAGLQGFLQRLAGYVLTGDITEEMLTFIHGPGQNGKGVFIGALSAIMGEYALAVPLEVFTVGARINLECHRADMAGARLVTASETEAGATWAESQIKEMTGNETKLSARRMYGHPFTYMPQFKLVIVGNHAPRLKSRTPAMERRLRIVPFTHTPAKPDEHLKEKLRAEYPAILRWAIDGCLAWQRERLGTCSVIAAATGQYFEGQDVLGEWLAERCEVGTGHAAAPGELLADFLGFARQNGAPPISGPEFREMLDGVGGLRRVKVQGVRLIQGVRLRHADPGAMP